MVRRSRTAATPHPNPSMKLTKKLAIIAAYAANCDDASITEPSESNHNAAGRPMQYHTWGG